MRNASSRATNIHTLHGPKNTPIYLIIIEHDVNGIEPIKEPKHFAYNLKAQFMTNTKVI